MASLGRLLWRWTAGLFAAVVILLALVIGLFRIVVSEVPEYRQPVADWASRAIGLPVDIGRLDARLRLGGPELVIENADIRSADGGEVLLSAERAGISLDVAALLLRWQLEPDSFTLEGVELELERGPEGELTILGHGLDDLPRGEGRLDGMHLRLRNSRLLVHDRMEGGQRWRFADLSLDVLLEEERLRIDGSFRPAGDVAGPVSFWVTADRAAAPTAWEGYLSIEALELAGLRRVPGLPGPLPEGGRLDARLWAGLAGTRPVRFSAELEAEGLALPGGGAPYDILSGRLDWDREDGGWVASADGLRIVRQGREWTMASARLEYGGEPDTLVYADADRMRLEDVAPMAALLPSAWTGEWLAGLAPRGEVTALTARLRLPAEAAGEPQGGAAAAIPGFEIEATLERVGVDAWGGWPGMQGVSGQLRGDDRGGRLELASQGLALDFPRLFRAPIAADTAEGLLLWRRGADGITLIGDGLSVANADAALAGSFRVRPPGENDEGLLEVRAEATDVDVAAAPRYLPVGRVPDNVVAWLDRAIVSGRVPSASINIQGPVRGFPYRDDQGRFEAGFGTEALVLDYARGWPRAEGIAADVRFENEGFSATLNEGSLGAMPVGETRVTIPDLRQGRLAIDGRASASLPVLEGFVAASPLARILGEGFMKTRFVGGQGEARVDLLLPVKNLAEREVAVDLAISGGVIGYGALPWRLESVSGEIDIRGAEVSAEDVTASLLGEPVEIRIGPAEGGATRAWVTGPLTPRALVSGLGLPLGPYLEGESRFQGYAHFPGRGAGGGDGFRLHAESGLEGMAIGLPAPLAKPAGTSLPLAMDFRFPRQGLSDWRVDFGDRLTGALRFSTRDGGLVFERGIVAAGAASTSLPETPGLHVTGRVETLDLDAWLGLDVGGDAGRGAGLRDLLAGGSLRADNFHVIGQHFADAQLALEQGSEGWRFSLESPAAAGEVMLPFGEGRMEMIFSRLHLDDDPQDAGRTEGGDPLDPNTVPPFGIEADDFRYAGVRLGRMEADIESIPGGLRLAGVSFSGPGYSASGGGRSVLWPAEDLTRLELEVTSDDVGRALEHMGFARSVEASEGRFATQLQWSGGLAADFLSRADGMASLTIENGTLSDVEPGAGRVFGLLSIQALPRRLTLDFRDVFKRGFHFDAFTGDFRIEDGVAHTDNLVFRSPAADIGIVGTVDLVEREYDQVAVLSAEVGNTLPLVGAIAGGPAIGAGLFVLKELFKEPLRGMVQVSYGITGPWNDPVVERLTPEELEAAGAPGAATGEPGQQVTREEEGARPRG